MPFISEPIIEEDFADLDKLTHWINGEEDKLIRIPILGMLENGAHFFDDEYFGDSSTFLKFNISSMRVLCSFLGFKFDNLNLIEQPSLISHVLNDLVSQRQIQDRFKSYEFVVDRESDNIIGIVSKSYVSYPNKIFIEDIIKLLTQNGQLPLLGNEVGEYRFVSGYSVNTQTFLRFVIRIEAGKVWGKGGHGEDITEIGFQFKNSMVGDSAVSIKYFLHRLLCANGLILPAGSSMSRVIHSGTRTSFMARLHECFKEIHRKVGTAGELVGHLMELQFSPLLLAKAHLSEQIFEIIPGSRSNILEEKGIKKVPLKNLTEAEKIKREATIIEAIPECYGGQHSRRVFTSAYRENTSMFDFINLFTEYAKDQLPERRIGIEEKAGVLANWITKNKRKFIATGA
jgi:hypothetical protein